MNSEIIRSKIELVLQRLSDSSTAVARHSDLRDLYPEFLILVHWMIRATIPLMQEALDRCREIQHRDNVASSMIPYLTQHIKEERDHDEWLLQDLETIGINRTDVLSRLPTPTAASCIGARYYWIRHHHPAAELGAISVMEGYPPTVEAIDYMELRSGYPRAAFRFIEKHAHIDIHHRDELINAINQMPLQQEHHEIIGVSALHTVSTVSALYREVIADHERRRVLDECETIA